MPSTDWTFGDRRSLGSGTPFLKNGQSATAANILAAIAASGYSAVMPETLFNAVTGVHCNILDPLGLRNPPGWQGNANR